MSKSVAEQMGRGASFSKARSVSARRAAVAAITGAPTEGVVPTDVDVSLISPNPDNPRSELGDVSDLGASLRDHGQKVAVTIMNRDAYVKANPEREGELEEGTLYVVIDGSSRLFAAREAGVPRLKVMVDDDMGTDADELLESALVANIHRQDLSEMDEARALQRLLKIHGTQSAVAQRLHRSQGWVSQRIALLGLTEELQGLVGQERIDLLRQVGTKPPHEQAAALARLKEQRKAKEKPKRNQSAPPAPPETSNKPADYYDVIDGKDRPNPESQDPPPPPTVGVPATRTVSPTAVPEAEEAAGLPVPRRQKTSPAAVDEGLLLDVDGDAEDVAQLLIERLAPAVLIQVTVLLQQHNRETVKSRPAAQAS
ncbi:MULTISPECIES: ParB/RepB/Spo0J family partition protein [unclassified Streptomyces]|uniref:ParB/RepB/Spo0J family partition protein n=1 Tax=unclassified Streptomyces TaxID=2593676 RepID=UPI0037F4A95F